MSLVIPKDALHCEVGLLKHSKRTLQTNMFLCFICKTTSLTMSKGVLCCEAGLIRHPKRTTLASLRISDGTVEIKSKYLRLAHVSVSSADVFIDNWQTKITKNGASSPIHQLIADTTDTQCTNSSYASF